jgi:hypothetical protein
VGATTASGPRHRSGLITPGETVTTTPNEPTDGEPQQGGTSPFSFDKPTEQPQQQDPPAPAESPYGQQPQPDPYGQPPHQDPYGQQASPYGQQAQQPDPYGQQPDPYGQQQASPYGQQASPYGQQGQQGYPAQGYGSYATGPAGPSSGLAIGALVAGVIALLMFWCAFIGVPVGIAAVVLGVVALNKVKAGTGGGRGLALAGVITGGVAILVSVVLVVAAIATGNADFSTSP